MTQRHADVPEMHWGSAPELIGPRHAYRVGRIAAWLAAALPAGHVLDAGCGAGTLTERIARGGYHVTAVDDSDEFVTHVTAHIAAAGLASHVTVALQDLETLDLPEANFDGIVCGEVLEHVADDASVLRHLRRVLKPGGVLVLTVPAGPERYDWLDRWAGHQRRYDEAGLRQLVSNAGLEIERLVRWGFPFMQLYEQFVQRPGLARAGRPGNQRGILARLARSAPVGAVFQACFTADRLFEGRVSQGTGFLVQARRPR
ncbi:MAG: hypothetical protein QOF51_3617 [Chloroflexota bacterium]|jgi:SAM-dependent methyltransferase|nr:hypothetical protein [Chloroflexota bacterium]